MRILVTGGTGFVGQSLCQYLSSRSLEVVASVRDDYPDRLHSGKVSDAERMTFVRVASLSASTD